MGRLFPAFVSALGLMTGCCVEVGSEQPSAPEIERPRDALQALAAADPTLASKLEMDPSVRQSWWTRPGRGDDPSRRIRFDPGVLALVLYPSTLLELPGAVLGIPASLFSWIFEPRESSKTEQLRRLAEEAAERALPLEGRPPK